MKIAFLTPFLPYPADTGGKIRSYNILKGLTQGHDVHVIVVHGESTHQSDRHIKSLGVKLHKFRAIKSQGPVTRLKRWAKQLPMHVDAFVTPNSLQQVQAHLREGAFDLIFCDEIVMTPYVEGITGPKKILALQNIDYELRKQIAARQPWGRERLSMELEARLLKRFSERIFAQRWDTVVVCSAADADVIKQANPQNKVEIVPNGVDLDFFSPTGKPTEVPLPDDMPTLLFVGTMFYYPNINAVERFFSEVYPYLRTVLPRFRVCIVGHSPPPSITSLPETFPNVIVTGSVEDVRPYYEKSSVVIVPLRLGGGTSLKIVQGLSMGRPIVSTDIGARGLHLQDGSEALIADTPKAFATAIADLVLDDSVRQRVTQHGKAAAQRFSWEHLAGDARRACEALVPDPQAPKSASAAPAVIHRDGPLKILCVSNLYPPYIIGGYERLAHRTMQELEARGHEVHVATGYGENLGKNTHGIYSLDLDRKEDVFLKPTQGKLNKLRLHLFHPHNYRATRRLLSEFQPDVVSAWNLYLLTVAPIIAARRLGYPVVTHLTDHWLVSNLTQPSQPSPTVTRINRAGLKAIRAATQPILYRQTQPRDLIIPSASLRQVYLDAGFDASAFHFLPHGIDTDKFPYQERTYGDVKQLVFVGQLWEGKGPQIMLQAIGKLVREGETDFHLDIYGDGDPGFINYLHSIVESEQIEEFVSFCGTVTHDELPDVYYAHDLLIFPSTWNEPFALTPVEAMSSGLPVIASDAGGTKEIVMDGENGVVVPAGQPAPLADALQALLHDEEKLRLYGQRSAQKARSNYSFGGMVDQVEEIYYAARERARRS